MFLESLHCDFKFPQFLWNTVKGSGPTDYKAITSDFTGYFRNLQSKSKSMTFISPLLNAWIRNKVHKNFPNISNFISVKSPLDALEPESLQSIYIR